MLYVILVVLCLLFVFCVIGFMLSLRQRNKTKRLQRSSDYDFKTENGRYRFIYTVKGFPAAEGKELKIALQPQIGFSDLKNAGTNGCEHVEISETDNRSGKVYFWEEEQPRDKHGLHPMNITGAILLPAEALDGQGAADAHVVVRTRWSLGGRQIEETLAFDYQK